MGSLSQYVWVLYHQVVLLKHVAISFANYTSIKLEKNTFNHFFFNFWGSIYIAVHLKTVTTQISCLRFRNLDTVWKRCIIPVTCNLLTSQDPRSIFYYPRNAYAPEMLGYDYLLQPMFRRSLTVYLMSLVLKDIAICEYNTICKKLLPFPFSQSS